MFGILNFFIKKCISLLNIDILEIQPSQFYLSAGKIEQIKTWFSPTDLSNFVPIPIKELNGHIIFTDGHTRAFVAYKAGLKRIPFYWDEEDLDWEMYQICVDACRKRNIASVADFQSRILPVSDYKRDWIGWCEVMQEVLELQRCFNRDIIK